MALVGLLFLGSIDTAQAADRCTPVFARVVSVQGSVEIRPAGANWEAALLNATLCAGDMVRVHQRSRAALLLSNQTTLRLDQGTALSLVAPDDKKATLLEQISGGLHVITRTPRAFNVKTPFVNANVEGTEFAVRVTPNDASITVYEGQVVAENEVGSVTLTSGEGAVATKSAAPRKEIAVRPPDAVAWTLYFPTLFDYQVEAGAAGGSPAQVARQHSIALYRSGQLIEALAGLDNVADGAADAEFLTYRAGLLLLVGRLDAAKPEIDQALRVDPNHSDAHALLAIVAVVENDKDKALELAGRAVSLNSASPAARIALSYVLQARFDIEQALVSVQHAVKLAPQSALARARLSELEMSTGNLDAALAAAREAVRINPNLSKTQTVLGFANLLRIDTSAAKESFGRAIELDAVDPLPRLGLGLAKVREGDLEAGRTEIEVATILDPRNSLVRSYLGKAYYEEKRDPLAKSQFGMAKEFDSQDPTPWFYDAVRSAANNEAGDALLSIQASIERNANRAVFRSRLLLDDDLAARSVNQARVYRQLGFEQLALVEAYRALARDPGNFSAHRFLADAYIDEPRHELARDNEVLQAQMWQPINLYPLQLQLTAAESGVFGSSVLFDPGLNEYDRLYVRNGIRAQALALTGAHGTRADQVLLTGVSQAVSYSLGQFHYETDSFRTNAQSRKDLYNAFVQISPTDRTSFHLEWRRLETEHGDPVLHFEPDFVTDLKIGLTKQLTRLGARHQFSGDTTLLVSLGAQHSLDTTDSESSGGRTFRDDRKERLREVQVTHRAGGFHVRAGVGLLTGSEEIEFFGTVNQQEQKSHNAYVYASLGELPGDVRVEGGLSRDYINDPNLAARFNQTNYKFGIGWDPWPGTSLRIARFRVLKRAGLADLTIEPTQVMGFNQFFDDFNGTDARRSAAALDHSFSSTVFAGVELSKRDLRVPLAFVDPIEVFDWRERSQSAYLSYLFNRSLAINLAYRYEVFERPVEFSGPDDFITLRTRRLPLTVTMRTSPSTSSRLRLTPIRQSGTFLHPDFSTFEGRSTFVIADATMDWRLPHRYGIATLGVQNLFDRQFRFQDATVAAPTTSPRRFAFARLSLTF